MCPLNPVSLASSGTSHPSLIVAPPSLAIPSFPPPTCLLCPEFHFSHHGQSHPSFPSISLAPCPSPSPALPSVLSFYLPQATPLTPLSPTGPSLFPTCPSRSRSLTGLPLYLHASFLLSAYPSSLWMPLYHLWLIAMSSSPILCP